MERKPEAQKPNTSIVAKQMAISAMTDEERDVIVRAAIDDARPERTARNKRKGGLLKIWDEYRVEVRRYCIMSMLNTGKSYIECKREMMERWNICKASADNYLKDALDAVSEVNDKYRDKWRDVQLERLQKIIDDALAHGDRKSALAANEQINKITGQYVTKVEADVKEDTTVRFDFGD